MTIQKLKTLAYFDTPGGAGLNAYKEVICMVYYTTYIKTPSLMCTLLF